MFNLSSKFDVLILFWSENDLNLSFQIFDLKICLYPLIGEKYIPLLKGAVSPSTESMFLDEG